MKNMMLITSSWKSGKTFKMIPTTADCPFVECIYDQELKVLAVIGRHKKDTFHMVEKIDPNGDPEIRKTPRRDGNPYKQERRALDTYQEYYLDNRGDIISFVNMFAINGSTFSIDDHLNANEEGLPQLEVVPTEEV